jgi:branched-chain amino acid transport system substrate-binding protein
MRKAVTMMVAVGALSLAAGAAKADILVGMQGPTTGSNAAFGDQMKRGFEQAVKDINAKGGVLGQQLKVDIEDDACDPKQAVAAANKLASAGAVFVDGGFCSGSSIPASAVYADGGVLQISPASTNPVLTDDAFKKGWNNVFRVCGRDDQQGAVAGQYLAKAYAGKPIAVVDDKSTYGKGLADETRATLNKLGTKEAMDEEITAGDKDFTALISKMKAANIAVIYYGGYVTEAGLIVRQAHDQGLNAILMSGDSMPTQDFWQITGAAGNGTIFTFSPDPTLNPAAKAVVDEFTAGGFKPEGYTLYSYATLQIFQQAAQAANSTKLADLVKAMHGTTFHTVIGDINFDKKGDPAAGGYVVWQWMNASYHML